MGTGRQAESEGEARRGDIKDLGPYKIIGGPLFSLASWPSLDPLSLSQLEKKAARLECHMRTTATAITIKIIKYCLHM